MKAQAIGGYFEFELTKDKEFHRNALRLNTGRNAFEYILLAKKYNKVYLPYFTCEVMLEPLQRNHIIFEFYHIDLNFEPLFDYSRIELNAAFLYTNYFALKDQFIQHLKSNCKNLIIDNAQSFYAKPVPGIDTFYSARKFFGVPDGAYLYTDARLDRELPVDVSYARCSHLLKRIDTSAEEGYADFIDNDRSLSNNAIKKMSTLTSSLLAAINYDAITDIRKNNFAYLHQTLANSNKLKIKLDSIGVPTVYPYWATKKLRVKLLENKVYTAIYWPSVKTWCAEGDLEFRMTDEIIHLPIDQRQTRVALDSILKIIKEWQ